MKKPFLTLLTFSLLASLSQPSLAGRLIPINDTLRQDLEVLKQRGVIDVDTSTWPLSSEAVERSLSQAQPKNGDDNRMLASIKQQLAQNQAYQFQVVANANGDKRPIVSSFDKNYDTQAPVGLTLGYRHDMGNIDYQLQATVNVDENNTSNKTNFDGSYVGTKLGNHRLAFGAIPMWWGNGVDGSLIRSNAARPVTGLLLQRADNQPINLPLLSQLGKVNYQITAGQLQDYTTVPEAKVIGMRATLQPNEAFQIGGSRIIMWGGEGREESLKSFGRALTGKYDNGGYGEDPSNQIAGLDAQINLRPLMNIPASVYGEFIGEDEAGGLPAKKAYLAGVKGYLPVMNQPWLWHVEWANTHYDFDKHGIIYTHSTYRDGYYQKGLPLGHPIGGDGKVASVGISGNVDASNRVGLQYAKAKVNQSAQSINAAFPAKQDLDILEANWRYQYNPNTAVKLGVWGKKDGISDDDEMGGNVVLEYGF